MPQTSCKDPTARQANGARSPTAGGLDPHLVEQIQAIAERHPGPFYVYDRATLRSRCDVFTAIPYDNKGIHFASMANTCPEFLRIVREAIRNVSTTMRHRTHEFTEALLPATG